MQSTNPQQVGVGDRASPGWYPDPNHPGATCYWDGTEWHPERLPEAGAAENTSKRTGPRVWPWIVVVAAVVLLLIASVATVLMLQGGDDSTSAQTPSTTTEESWTAPSQEETDGILAANPGVFSSVVTGSNFASMVQLQGDTITRWQYLNGSWRAGATEVVDDMTYSEVQTVDVTNEGVLDYFVTGTGSDGAVYGTVLVTSGPSIQFAPLVDSTGSYGAYSPLSVDPETGELISDLAGSGTRMPGDPPVLFWTYDPELVQFTIQE
jgi:hypothetical protein